MEKSWRIPGRETATACTMTCMAGTQSLFRNAYALMAATVLTSALGMAFWAVAARMYDAETVGRAAAAIAAMLLVANAAQLNLSVGLMRFLPVTAGHEKKLVLTSYLAAAFVGFMLSSAFLLISPILLPELQFLTDSAIPTFLFISGVVVWTVFSLQDAVLTGIRAAIWVPIENTAFGVLKLLLLVVLAAGLSTYGILVSWVVPMAVMLVPVNLLIFRHLLPRMRTPTASVSEMPAPRSMAKFIGGDYVGTLLSHTSTTALPLLVISLAGPEESAVFYVAWTLGAALDFIATGTASSFLVEGAAHPDTAIAYRHAAAKRATLLLAPALVGTALLADPLLWFFGQEYRQARWAVVLLCLAALPRMLLLLRLAHLRIQRRISTVVWLQALGCAAMLSLSTLALQLGLGSTGVAGCWLITETIVLAAALLTPRHDPAPTSSPGTAPTPRGVSPQIAIVSGGRTHDRPASPHRTRS